MLFSFSLSLLPPSVSSHQGSARKVMMLKPEKVQLCEDSLGEALGEAGSLHLRQKRNQKMELFSLNKLEDSPELASIELPCLICFQLLSWVFIGDMKIILLSSLWNSEEQSVNPKTFQVWDDHWLDLVVEMRAIRAT